MADGTKVRYEIVGRAEGRMGEVIDFKFPPAPTLAEVMAVMSNLAMVVETVTTLHELPSAKDAAEKARAMIAQLGQK